MLIYGLHTPRTMPELLNAQGIVMAPVPTIDVQTENIIVNAPCFFSPSKLFNKELFNTSSERCDVWHKRIL